MNHEFIEAVYDTLQGNLVTPVPGIANAFAPGRECEKLYADMLAAYARLCRRLGDREEDEDVEVIINSLLRIQKVLCMEMYFYGAEYGGDGHRTGACCP